MLFLCKWLPRQYPNPFEASVNFDGRFQFSLVWFLFLLPTYCQRKTPKNTQKIISKSWIKYLYITWLNTASRPRFTTPCCCCFFPGKSDTLQNGWISSSGFNSPASPKTIIQNGLEHTNNDLKFKLYFQLLRLQHADVFE